MMNLRSTPQPEDFGIIRPYMPKYPEYTVVTPQTGISFNVRCLTVGEVSRLRSSLLSPSKVYSALNELVWNSITNKPEFIKTYDDFLRSVTIRDREALLYGIFVSTFGYNQKNEKFICDSCGNENLLNYDIGSAFSINMYPGTEAVKNLYTAGRVIDNIPRDEEVEKHINESKKQMSDIIPENILNAMGVENIASENVTESQSTTEGLQAEGEKIEISGLEQFIKYSILSKEIAVELPHSRYTCIIYTPTLLDEMSLAESFPTSNKQYLDIITKTLFIKRIEYYNEYVKDIIKIHNKMDIFQHYMNLPVGEDKLIFEKYRDEFDQYRIDLTLRWNCMSCGYTNSTYISLTDMFFRMVATG